MAKSGLFVADCSMPVTSGVCRTKKSHKPSYGRIALQEGDFFIALAKKKATMPLLFLSFTTFVG
jgi:hypothetical protein